MFTGIVEAVGEILSFDRAEKGAARLIVSAPDIAAEARLGESIAVNGCCLTLAAEHPHELSFDLLDETIRRTNLGTLSAGSLVNLERALLANARLGGHFVQGHIDCACPVRSFEKVRADYRLEVEMPSAFARYVVTKGSIALNGVSLTAADVNAASFAVWIIPHTFSATNLRTLAAEDLVNIECDVLAKYVERLLRP